MTRRRRIAVPLFTLGGLALGVWFVVRWPMLTRDSVGPPTRELPPEIACNCGEIDDNEKDDIATRMKMRDELQEQFRALRGHTEVEIVARYGPPSHRWKGHYGLPSIGYQAKYPDQITAVYHRGTCTLYVSYCRERGRLVCLAALLVTENTTID